MAWRYDHSALPGALLMCQRRRFLRSRGRRFVTLSIAHIPGACQSPGLFPNALTTLAGFLFPAGVREIVTAAEIAVVGKHLAVSNHPFRHIHTRSSIRPCEEQASHLAAIHISCPKCKDQGSPLPELFLQRNCCLLRPGLLRGA